MAQQLISISDAAVLMGRKPGEVERLIDAGQVRSVVLVDADSLPYTQEQS